MLTKRYESLESVAKELASVRDVNSVLETITRQAGVAVRAPATCSLLNYPATRLSGFTVSASLRMKRTWSRMKSSIQSTAQSKIQMTNHASWLTSSRIAAISGAWRSSTLTATTSCPRSDRCSWPMPATPRQPSRRLLPSPNPATETVPSALLLPLAWHSPRSRHGLGSRSAWPRPFQRSRDVTRRMCCCGMRVMRTSLELPRASQALPRTRNTRSHSVAERTFGESIARYVDADLGRDERQTLPCRR